jgi:LacI family transcriptional regulator
VINGGDRVSSETFASVTRAISELGFVPNLAARVLKGEKSKTIGLIVPSIADPFFANCAEVVQKVARSFGCLVVVCVTGNEAALELENIDSLCRRVDGILIAPSQSSSKILNARLSGLSIPVVCFDQPLIDTQIPGVLTNNYQSAMAVTEHLLQHGYGRILCIGGEATFHTMLERTRGYVTAMRAANKTPVIDTSPEIRSEAETAAVLARYLGGKRPPRAIYCLKNTTTIQTYDVLQRFGVRVPQEIALAGHDDFLLASSLRPSVTVVQQPVEEIGRMAAKLLFERLSHHPDKLAGQQETRSRTVRLKSRLILRASCGCEEVEPTGLLPTFRLNHHAELHTQTDETDRNGTSL